MVPSAGIGHLVSFFGLLETVDSSTPIQFPQRHEAVRVYSGTLKSLSYFNVPSAGIEPTLKA